MYEALTINQLIDCLNNQTPCYVIDRNISYKILICEIVFTSVWCKVVCTGVNFNGEVIPPMIGLSEDHAWALHYSSELDKVQKTIKDAKELEKELMEKLVQFVKKVNGE